MPFVESQGARIHFQISGPEGGEPVVLIMGLGWDMTGWDAMLPFLGGFRILRLDNRGAGLSDAPDVRYTIPMMASDALAVMDAAGFKSAHVYGASLGSMIAQEIALSQPERVRSLILGCPSPGFLSVPGSPGILRVLLTRHKMSPEEALRQGAPYLVHRQSSYALLEERMRNRPPSSPVGYRRQLRAVFGWSSLPRLARLRIPTLIIHGDRDRLIPIPNGRLIARMIPGATMHVIKDAGHVYSLDAPGEAATAAAEFMSRHRVGREAAPDPR